MKRIPDPSGRQRHQAFRIELIRRGLSIADIGRLLAVDRTAVTHAILGRGRSARIEAALTAMFPEVIHQHPFLPSRPDLAVDHDRDNCACDQGNDQPSGLRGLTPRQRDLVRQLEERGGRARLDALPGWAPHAIVRVATTLRDRGVLSTPGRIVLPEHEVEVVHG